MVKPTRIGNPDGLTTAASTAGTSSGDDVDWPTSPIGGGSADIPAGTYELAIEGGQSVIFPHGSMGSTETIDPTDGNVHTGTLTADVTYTLNAPTGSGAAEIEFERTASGGPWTETWPGSVTWLGGSAPTPPTAGSAGIVILRSLNGGTTWLGVPVGGSGGSALTVEDEGTPLATAADTLDFVGAGVTASGTGAAKTITIPGVTEASVRDVGHWEVVVSGTGPPVAVSTPADDDWVYAWVPG